MRGYIASDELCYYKGGGESVCTLYFACKTLKIICNGKQSSHGNVFLQTNNEAVQSRANATQNDVFCDAANDPKMDLTQLLATFDKSI